MRPPQSLRSHWNLDPRVACLNHGSFGACPQSVLEEQNRWRARMERDPMRFFVKDLEALLDEAAGELARFLGAHPEDLVFVPNATSGVNSVLRSLRLETDDEILTTNHEYNACLNTVRFVVERAGARVVVASIPFPIGSPEEAVQPVLDAVTPRTRLALLSHVTSQTGLVLPVARLVGELRSRGVETLVDGAHAPGMVPVDLAAQGAAYTAGNCHKWLCAPKGAGFLHVRRDLQESVRPFVISHGANAPPGERSRFRVEFGWMGTLDPSAYLAVPAALRFMGTLLPGGWNELMASNHAKVFEGRRVVCEALDLDPPAPEEMIGSLASLPLPDGSPDPPSSPLYGDPLQDELLERGGVQVPVIPWPAPPRRLIRISAQIYNEPEEYRRLGRALREIL